MASILKSLRVLSDPIRLRLLLLLLEEELTVAELQEILGLGQSRISTSLAQLKREELVRDRRVGKIFSIQQARILAMPCSPF
jgi:ArsR family transcriptional regulator